MRRHEPARGNWLASCGLSRSAEAGPACSAETRGIFRANSGYFHACLHAASPTGQGPWPPRTGPASTGRRWWHTSPIDLCLETEKRFISLYNMNLQQKCEEMVL